MDKKGSSVSVMSYMSLGVVVDKMESTVLLIADRNEFRFPINNENVFGDTHNALLLYVVSIAASL